ncbi:MAG: thioredoxin family protein [Thiomicrorhabdus sp.]|nr:thioredoxin family protein [Thiomicrorhabdus sp.]
MGKVEDIAEIAAFGVMSTPGVVINGKVVHSGSIPTKADVTEWLSSPTEVCCG